LSASNALENAILLLLFNTTTIANLADDTAASPAATLTVSLHTGDPGEAGDMTTSEADYTSYARVTVARSGAGWTVSSNAVSPAAQIDFPACGGGTNTITHFGVGTGVSDNLLFSGTVTPNISVSTGVTPSLTTDTSISVD
jgi:hypothetical protein